MTEFVRCMIDTTRPYTIKSYQNEKTTMLTLEQGGREFSFDICTDQSIISTMAPSFTGMVFTGALWGKNQIEMMILRMFII